ncbi:hypothetical protein N7474_007899 [Penicillium riverlandense]|uniref:uncharacterized protein n=1 Tax=Penicillium riverlandense TaxID=1903569 RepID=UPI0025494E6F|nr:uncharacterized protein N7474_007899 [Penicillium riverlandense]KAJ5811598.1 hypothetical protein N7474_007899 [Penicillium riverlandense]
MSPHLAEYQLRQHRCLPQSPCRITCDFGETRMVIARARFGPSAVPIRNATRVDADDLIAPPPPKVNAAHHQPTTRRGQEPSRDMVALAFKPHHWRDPFFIGLGRSPVGARGTCFVRASGAHHPPASIFACYFLCDQDMGIYAI